MCCKAGVNENNAESAADCLNPALITKSETEALIHTQYQPQWALMLRLERSQDYSQDIAVIHSTALA